MRVHLGCGLLAAVLMVFHERFFVSLVIALWYLVSLLLLAGMKAHAQWCRVVQGLWFMMASAAGFYYLLWVVPGIQPATPPVLSLALLPFWLPLLSLLYTAAGLLVLVSRRVIRATMSGFELWSPPEH